MILNLQMCRHTTKYFSVYLRAYVVKIIGIVFVDIIRHIFLTASCMCSKKIHIVSDNVPRETIIPLSLVVALTQGKIFWNVLWTGNPCLLG